MKRVGIGGLRREQHLREAAQRVGDDLAAAELAEMTRLMAAFRAQLGAFAERHRAAVSRDADLRQQLQRMCVAVGVDALASNKGFMARVLGLGDFYYSIAVQVVELCMRSRPANGGLVALDDLLAQLNARRAAAGLHPASGEDVERALDAPAAPGPGFAVLQ